MDMSYRKYAPLWNKYRPAILQMMLAAAYEPQEYKLGQHEFKAMDEKKRGSFGFQLTVAGAKAQNNVKGSEAAQDLLSMLQLSRKGSELMQQHTYEIELDKQCVLRIRQVTPA